MTAEPRKTSELQVKEKRVGQAALSWVPSCTGKGGQSLRFRGQEWDKEREDEHIDPFIKHFQCLWCIRH